MKFIAFRNCIRQYLFGNEEWCVDYAVKELLMEKTDETFLPIGPVMDWIGNGLFSLSESGSCLFGIERRPSPNVVMCRAEGHRVEDAAEKHESNHSR